MADADDLDVFFLAAEKFAYCFGLGTNSAGGSFLDEDVAVAAVLKGEENKIHGFVEAHDEAGHRGLGKRNRVAIAGLFDPQRNH